MGLEDGAVLLPHLTIGTVTVLEDSPHGGVNCAVESLDLAVALGRGVD